MTATALASSIPSDAEAAARIQTLVTPFGRGQINLTVDPAEVGENVMHLYFLDPPAAAGGRPTPRSAWRYRAPPSKPSCSIPGRATTRSWRRPSSRPGTYSVVVTASVEAAATGTVTDPVTTFALSWAKCGIIRRFRVSNGRAPRLLPTPQRLDQPWPTTSSR